MNVHFKIVLGIAAGGAIGTLLRYALNLSMLTFHYPFGTLLENVLGSLLLGALTGFTANATNVPEWLKLSIGAGLLGSFSTMSTLASDAILMTVRGGLLLQASGYIMISLIGGLAAAFLGYIAGQKIACARSRKGAVS